MHGLELIQVIAAATGLPKQLIITEIQTLASQKGIAPEDLSLSQLRNLLANYMQDILIESKRNSLLSNSTHK